MEKAKNKWRGDDKSGVELIMKKFHVQLGMYQLGLTKVFIKAPETVSGENRSNRV